MNERMNIRMDKQKDKNYITLHIIAGGMINKKCQDRIVL